MENNKEKFIRLFKEYITRPGSEALLEYIEGTDFFEAPASTRYHGNYRGGLVEHSLNVLECMATSFDESTVIVSLLHDLCKANFYKIDYRNVKQPDGSWVRMPYYTIEDALPIGNHGDKSVFIIQRFMPLHDHEIAAIRYHMGGFSEGDKNNFSLVCEKYPLTVHLHIADMQATYLHDKKV